MKFVFAVGLLLVTSPASGQTLQALIDRAAPGDTLFIPPGTYDECPVIRQPLVLLAAQDVTVGGTCPDNVFTVRAPATIKGFHITGTGTNLSRENSGIWADNAAPLVIEDNTLTDVLFGIYVKRTPGTTVRGNTVTGKDLPMAARGDAIRFWYSPGVLVEDNHVTRARDLVIWFSDSAVVKHNSVSDSRYGLHYMYSHHSRFEHNDFVRNEVGAFLMYSNHIIFRHNLFAYSRGIFGKGLGFKDSEYVVATNNTIVKNGVGLYLDNSPTSVGVQNRFAGNTFAYNDVGIGLLPSVKNNVFSQGAFVDNLRPVSVSGGGTAAGNAWGGNYWSEYAGFDADGDGVGDTPFQLARLSDDLFTRHEDLRVFTLSPAAEIVDLASRVIPTLVPTVVVVDSQPLLTRPAADTVAPDDPDWLAAGVFLILAACAATAGVTYRRGIP